MAIVLSAVRLFLAVVVVCSLVALAMVLFGSAGVDLHHHDMNRWSGLVGMLLVGSAAPAAAALASPKWVLANPLAIGLPVLPLIVLLLVQLSTVIAPSAQVWALIGAIGAALAVLSLPAVGRAARRQGPAA